MASGPRRRLCSKPDGLQSGLLVVELPVAGYPARAHREHRKDPGTHARPAGRSPSPLASDHEHIVTAVDEPFGLAPILLPILEPSLPRLPYAVVPAVDSPVGAPGVLDPFDIRLAALLDQLRETPPKRAVIHGHRF